MTKCTPSFFIASMLAFALHVAPAQAQSRVFVAAQGSDGNPCTFALPCRTFQHAHDVVAANGEIDVLDPAGYGALTISKAISIQGHGFSGISASGGNAITINAGAGDNISLRGLLIDGVGTGGIGIAFNSGGSLNIQDGVIRNFINPGISFVPSASTPSTLFVTDTHISNLSGGPGFGINVAPTGSGTVTGAFKRIVIEQIFAYGVAISSASGTGSVSFTISDSLITNSLIGINISAAAAPTTVTVEASSVVNSTNAGIAATGSNAKLQITKCTIAANVIGMGVVTGGSIISGGDNFVGANGSDGAPTLTIGLK